MFLLSCRIRRSPPLRRLHSTRRTRVAFVDTEAVRSVGEMELNGALSNPLLRLELSRLRALVA